MKALTHHLILCSNSPRRKEILSNSGYEFNVFSEPILEEYPDDLPPTEVAEFLAIKKNRSYQRLLADKIILTADTTVIANRELLEKPVSEADAHRMIKALSGQTHQVISGVCISEEDKTVSFSDITEVSFDELEPNEIKYYIENYKPFDKAGSYGIQEWLGLIGIKRITGSYFNVVGLPIHKVYKVLKESFNLSPLYQR